MRDLVPGEARIQKSFLEEFNQEGEHKHDGEELEREENDFESVVKRLEETEDSRKVKEVLHSYGHNRGKTFARAGLQEERAGAVAVKLAEGLTQTLYRRQKSEIEEIAEIMDVVSLGIELFRNSQSQSFVADYLGPGNETIYGVPDHSVQYEIARSFMEGYEETLDERNNAPGTPDSYASSNLTD